MVGRREGLIYRDTEGYVQGHQDVGIGMAQSSFFGETLFSNFLRAQEWAIPHNLRYNNKKPNHVRAELSTREWDALQSLVEKALDLECLTGERIEDERIRDRLFSLLRPQIYQMVRALVRDPHIADDITQDALLRLWHRLTLYNPKIAPFRVWVSRVVINLTYNAIRSHNRTAHYEIRESDWADPASSTEEPFSFFETTASTDPDPSEHVSDRERLDLILACAREVLSPDEYLVWLEQVTNNSSYQEIAMLLDRNEAWARQTMLRARQKVAAAIVLHPRILSDAEIRSAITRCQQSGEVLSAAELEVLQDALRTQGERKPPGWRRINLFRQACYKLLPYLLGGISLALWWI